MPRILVLIAAVTLLQTIAVGAPAAQAVVCSYDVCVSNCNTNGGKHCLRGCDRRIARRLSNGLCPWLGFGGLSLNRQVRDL
jgi:hypothetical protein